MYPPTKKTRGVRERGRNLLRGPDRGGGGVGGGGGGVRRLYHLNANWVGGNCTEGGCGNKGGRKGATNSDRCLDSQRGRQWVGDRDHQGGGFHSLRRNGVDFIG